MPYITSVYYNDTFKGKPASSPEELDRMILRASDVIDSLTFNRIAKGEVNLETGHPFVKAQVEKATAAMVEYYVISGGYDATIDTGAQSLGLGSFNYSMKGTNGKAIDVPSNVVSYLVDSGLLYAGINVAGGGVYYDS
jgi:flagellar hook assembly protein FlgD